MKEMIKMLEKKKKSGKELDPMYASSKMSVLQQLRDQMAGLMKDDLQPGKMKKVEVAASDEEGLKHGLDKAKEVLSGSEMEPMEEKDEGSPEEERAESPEEKAEEMAMDASDEDLDAMIKKLEEMKQHKKSMMV
jgi:hypothetical protein